jgi:tetratricopeptide (TPR) repeat protein
MNPGDDSLLARAEACLSPELARKAQDLAARHLAAHPDDPEGKRILAMALTIQNRSDEALPLARQAVAALPDSEAAWLSLACAAIAQHDGGEAWTAVRRCVHLAPDDPVAHSAWAEADYSFEAATQETLVHAGWAVHLDPADPDYHALYGRVADQLKMVQLARTAFEEALRIDPGHEGAQIGLAGLALDAGDPGAAAGTYSTLLRRDPSSQDVLLNLLSAATMALNQASLIAIVGAMVAWVYVWLGPSVAFWRFVATMLLAGIGPIIVRSVRSTWRGGWRATAVTIRTRPAMIGWTVVIAALVGAALAVVIAGPGTPRAIAVLASVLLIVAVIVIAIVQTMARRRAAAQWNQEARLG